MLGARQRHHRKPMRERRQMLLKFVRRTARRNEMHFVEIEPPVRGASDGQVPGMNRIERTAKERDAAWMVLRGGAMRVCLRRGCRQSASQEVTSDEFLTEW
jgi:hypothetical protein